MIFAIYLLICGIALPILCGIYFYKKSKERSKGDNGKTQRNVIKDEQQS